MKYDYVIIGAGLYGACFAYKAKQNGKRVLVLDKRNHIGGNLYCSNENGINVHLYGPHIFHTSNKEVWDFVNSLTPFNNFINTPIANHKGIIYNLPFNMNTFNTLWGVNTPAEAKCIINKQRDDAGINIPQNLEEQAISLVGTDIYEILIKGYTQKQWGRECSDLPSEIIKRLPVRFTYDNNYFNDIYQGIPIGGYNKLIEALLENIDTKINCNYFDNKDAFDAMADKIVFTGRIDEFYNYKYGKLEYRTVRFEHEVLESDNYQGVAVVNYTDVQIPYTRIIEHKHFEYGTQSHTIISREYPAEWKDDEKKGGGAEPYYPVGNTQNIALYERYRELAQNEMKYIFGGRLAEYKYYDMHHIVEKVLTIKDI